MKKSIVTLVLSVVLLVTAYYGVIFSLKSFLWLAKADSGIIGLVIVLVTIFYLALVEIKNLITQ
jgi:hypothetical protein